MGKEKKISREDIAKMSREERMKYEIAQELGLLDQVLEEGWKTLSAKETGRIGGIMNRRQKQKEKEDFLIRRKTYQEPSFFNASETDWTYADITR